MINGVGWNIYDSVPTIYNKFWLPFIEVGRNSQEVDPQWVRILKILLYFSDRRSSV